MTLLSTMVILDGNVRWSLLCLYSWSLYQLKSFKKSTCGLMRKYIFVFLIPVKEKMSIRACFQLKWRYTIKRQEEAKLIFYSWFMSHLFVSSSCYSSDIFMMFSVQVCFVLSGGIIKTFDKVQNGNVKNRILKRWEKINTSGCTVLS